MARVTRRRPPRRLEFSPPLAPVPRARSARLPDRGLPRLARSPSPTPRTPTYLPSPSGRPTGARPPSSPSAAGAGRLARPHRRHRRPPPRLPPTAGVRDAPRSSAAVAPAAPAACALGGLGRVARRPPGAAGRPRPACRAAGRSPSPVHTARRSDGRVPLPVAPYCREQPSADRHRCQHPRWTLAGAGRADSRRLSATPRETIPTGAASRPTAPGRRPGADAACCGPNAGRAWPAYRRADVTAEPWCGAARAVGRRAAGRRADDRPPARPAGCGRPRRARPRSARRCRLDDQPIGTPRRQGSGRHRVALIGVVRRRPAPDPGRALHAARRADGSLADVDRCRRTHAGAAGPAGVPCRPVASRSARSPVGHGRPAACGGRGE